MDWKDCLDKRIAKNINSDLEMVGSLIRSSENKFKSEEKLSISNITVGSKISLAYDSLRELLEALALQNGYKIYNHECYTFFLKEIIKESEKGQEFDELRKIRNNINYYGKNILVEEAEYIIRKIKNLRNKIATMLKAGLRN